MTLKVFRVSESLPKGFSELVTEADAEGIRNMQRLSDAWGYGERFDKDGECLMGAHMDGRLVGVGALSSEVNSQTPALRLRRFYVLPSYRRKGGGSALASALIQLGFTRVALLTVNAGASPAAGPFWEALGFKPDITGPWTHILRRV